VEQVVQVVVQVELVDLPVVMVAQQELVHLVLPLMAGSVQAAVVPVDIQPQVVLAEELAHQVVLMVQAVAVVVAVVAAATAQTIEFQVLAQVIIMQEVMAAVYRIMD
jgi:Na+/citrate or Na+/malate symporter